MSQSLPGPERPADWPPPANEPPRRRRPHPLTVAAIVVAAVAGAVVAVFVTDNASQPSTPASSPSYVAPRPGGGAIPSGGVGRIMILGAVRTVSGESITITGNGQPVTAAVTKNTKITGRVHTISGISVGDTVSAQITLRRGRAVATAIQDPPAVGSLGG